MFNPGDLVECIDNNGFSVLVVYQIYQVSAVDLHLGVLYLVAHPGVQFSLDRFRLPSQHSQSKSIQQSKFKIGDIVYAIVLTDGGNGPPPLFANYGYTIAQHIVHQGNNHYALKERPGWYWPERNFILKHQALSTQTFQNAVNSIPGDNPNFIFDDELPKNDHKYFKISDKPQSAKCECGVDSVGGGMHSSWCPKARHG